MAGDHPTDASGLASYSSSTSSSSSSSSSSSLSSSLVPRIISGSLGSMAVALAVTPLEVAKIRQQQAAAAASSSSSSSFPGATSFRGVRVGCLPCRECGSTVVLNNGLMECVLPMPMPATRSTTMPAVPSQMKARMTMTMTMTMTGGHHRNNNMGTISTLVSIFENEGAAGLYAGLRPTLVMSVPNTVLYFAAYDELSSRLRRHRHRHHQQYDRQQSSSSQSQPAHIPLLAGSAARLLATLATAPLELVRTRQAAAKHDGAALGGGGGKRRGVMGELLHLTRSGGGVSSLYSGLAPTLWRDVPFSAIYWLFLERFRDALRSSYRESHPPAGGGVGYRHHPWGGAEGGGDGDILEGLPPVVEAGHAFVAGAAAGSVAAAFTTPFDVVKTRRQIAIVGRRESSSSHRRHHHHRGADCSESTRKLPDLDGACATKGGGGNSSSGRRRGIVFVGDNNMGTFGHMRHIVEREGMSGLWKGNVTRMAKVAPA